MAGITNKTVSNLFGLAAGLCSICKIPVVQRNVKIGEMAHIIAKRKSGTRGNLPVVGDINGYDNLILLCPNHHTEVDNDEASYPPERLHQIKDEHEAYVRQVFNHQSQGRVMDLDGLVVLMKFLPFTHILGYTLGLPTSFDMHLFDVDDCCCNFGKDFPQCRPFCDSHLERHFIDFWSDIRHLNNYVQSACFDNKTGYVASERIDSTELYLNRDLSHAKRQEVKQEIERLLTNLNNSYHDFLRYVKNTYPEVNLAAFVGWKRSGCL